MKIFDFLKIFFDDTKTVLSRFVYFIVIIICLFLINDILGFSNNWVMSNKIENIQKIENIKRDNISDYTLNPKLIERIDTLENHIIDRKPIIYSVLEFFKDITLGKIEIDLWYLFSVHWFGILVLFIMIPETYRKGFWDLIGMLFLVIIIMGLWYYLLEFMYGLLGIEEKFIKYFFNYGFFIIIGIIIALKQSKIKK